MKFFLIIVCLITSLVACQPKTSQQTEDQAQSIEKEHDHEHEAVPVLIISDQLELYAECEAFFEGHTSEIRAHLTTLDPFRPIVVDSLSVRWQQGIQFSDWISLGATETGIYSGGMPVPEAGEMNLEFRFPIKNQDTILRGNGYPVLEKDQEPSDSEHQDGVSFTLEQSWETEFGLMKVQAESYQEPLHCSGKFLLPPDCDYRIISPATGQVIFTRSQWSAGSWIKKGEDLFTLVPVGFGDDQFKLEWTMAKARFDEAKANYLRKKELIETQAVSQQDLESAKASFAIAEAKYELLKGQISDSGISIKSPESGYLKSLNCQPFGYVDQGTLLIQLMAEGTVWLQADVPADLAPKLKQISSANFKVPGEYTIHQLDNYDGKLLSTGRSLHENSGFIPVVFAMNSTDFLPGSYAEVWLLSEEQSDQIVIPKSCLIEEYGMYYVYVQVGGEMYEKRLVHLTSDDGIQVRIGSGLSVGEMIVSSGAMAIKVANTIGALPAHSHSH